ncbi:Survival factor 1 [Neonectria ditissima]|uniref:Survival factor 1 n=1 Tax=Neonectria ditissima TaxID=78410 RepID=A0A0P7AXH4_9HYPO|nr:Survival factor 1 [Neonectria ditissima]
MFNWAKQQIAYVAGTQEPVYGPDAIRSVAVEAEKTPFTELTRESMTWAKMESTCVETQIFYVYTEEGHVAFFEVIYSNVVGLRTTCQFLCKLFYPEKKPDGPEQKSDGEEKEADGTEQKPQESKQKPHLWTSTQLNNPELALDYTAFYADDCSVELSDDGSFYTIKSDNDERSIVNLTVSRVGAGFRAGTSGSTYFGTDPENPWGSMKHAFWPRCLATGSIKTEGGLIEFKDARSSFIHALQGMKPHHAAARWNFVNFHGPKYSAVMMEFTTPASYGDTVVNVGCIANDDGVVVAGCNNTATHTTTEEDVKSGWQVPVEARYTWSGTDQEGKAVEGVIEGPLNRTDRVDIMEEVPGFIKTIISSAAGTRPYLYQFRPELSLKLKIGDEEVVEEGVVYAEATFIS